MTFAGSIQASRNPARCTPAGFGLVIPIAHRLTETVQKATETALANMGALGARVFRDATLDGFVEVFRDTGLTVIAPVTHTDRKTGKLEFSDGFRDPAEIAERLSQVERSVILDLTTCYSVQLVEEIKKWEGSRIEPVAATDTVLDLELQMMYYEAVVRLLAKAGAKASYRELVGALWNSLPEVLKRVLA